MSKEGKRSVSVFIKFFVYSRLTVDARRSLKDLISFFGNTTTTCILGCRHTYLLSLDLRLIPPSWLCMKHEVRDRKNFAYLSTKTGNNKIK